MISPMPPVAAEVGMPWDVRTDDPVQALAGARSAHGDTFVVDSGDDRFLFTFSPRGVASFYALPEDRASKAVADWRMLRRKLPDEIFLDRRVVPHGLFGRESVAEYLQNVDLALDATLDALGTSGEFEIFTFSRRLGHRIGLASWGGPSAAEGERFDRLVAAFDALDGAESFVRPDAMAAVEASGKSLEREALRVVIEEIGSGLSELSKTEVRHPLFERVAVAWQDEPPEKRTTGVALDVALIHVASMSNLFAALGWVVVDLLEHPDHVQRIRSGNRTLAESCALESIRLAQRSIMGRYVLRPVAFDVGDAVHDVSPGVTIATLLPLTNTSAAPGLEAWDPGRWKGRRLADASEFATVELVTSFGHGRHTCPAQPFSLSAITKAVTRLFAEFELEPTWFSHPGPVRAQIGGVARSADPCMVRYRQRVTPSSA